MGELAAIWPTAGGQYHFQWALTSEKWRKVMVSFVTCDFWESVDENRVLRLVTSIFLDGLRS